LRAIAEAGGAKFFAASNVDELNTALKKAASGYIDVVGIR